MSDFSVNLHSIEIEPHPNADALELAVIGGFRSVVPKGKYKTHDIVVYFQTASLLTDDILKACGFWDEEKQRGTLSGQGNRVKPARLRGELSEGIVALPHEVGITIDNDHAIDFDHDYATELGVIKWIPSVPAAFSGKWQGSADIVPMSDVENGKSSKFARLLWDPEYDGEDLPDIIITEKIHGSCCVVNLRDGVFTVTSKGLSKRNITLEEDAGNIYWQMANKYNLRGFAEWLVKQSGYSNVAIFGEVFGAGVQSGFNYSPAEEKQYRIFDIVIDGNPISNWGAWKLTAEFNQKNPNTPNVQMVPLLYSGRLSTAEINQLISGAETVSGHELHMREGVVVSVEPPVFHPRTRQRRRLKYISPEYLVRGGKNVTEYE